MNTPLWQIKKEMCDVGHRIWLKGFCAGNEGNHSVRIAPDRVLCTPTFISKGFLNPDDICVIDMEGKQVEPNPKGRKRTSEALVHLAIYKARPDVNAVIHSHPPHAVAFCIANIPLPEGIHPEAEIFLGKVPVARYATPSTPDLPASVVQLIKPDTNTVLMANHGSVSFSTTLIDAYYKLEILDAYCRQLILAKQLGRIAQLTAAQMTDLLTLKQKFGMPDSRLACIPQGCVGSENQPFLATFDDRPQTASCSCTGGQVHHHSNPPPNPTPSSSFSPRVPAGSASQLPPASPSDPAFESLVQLITDQIMTAAAR